MYPGSDIGHPLSSIRLEIVRDGEEDYEYLIMLDKLIAKAEANGSSPKEVNAARAVLRSAHRLVASMTDYEKNPEPYLRIRERVAEAIERLSAKGKKDDRITLSAPLTHSDWMMHADAPAWGSEGIRTMLTHCKQFGLKRIYWRVFDAAGLSTQASCWSR